MQTMESLVDLFQKEMFEPVTKMLEEKAMCEGVDMTHLQSAMISLKEQFITRINKSASSSPENKNRSSSSANSSKASLTPPPLSASVSETSESSSLEKSPSSLISDAISSGTTVSQPEATITEKGNKKKTEIMTKRNKKRSLEDTVQKLCDKKSKISKQNDIEKQTPSPVTSNNSTPLATTPNQGPNMFPAMTTPINTMLLARLLNPASSFPLVNPTVYLNALNIIQQQNALSSYMAKGNVAQSSVLNSSTSPITAEQDGKPDVSECQTPEICVDEVKVSDSAAESDDLSLSPCPSNGEEGSEPSETSISFSACSENDLEKPFVCIHKNCGKRFANKFLLKKHQFIHTGLRPHQCPYCNKRFNRKDNLLRHKKTHQPLEQHSSPVSSVAPFSIQSTPTTGDSPSSGLGKFGMPNHQIPSNCFMMDNLKIDNFKFQMEVLKQYNQWKAH